MQNKIDFFSSDKSSPRSHVACDKSSNSWFFAIEAVNGKFSCLCTTSVLIILSGNWKMWLLRKSRKSPKPKNVKSLIENFFLSHFSQSQIVLSAITHSFIANSPTSMLSIESCLKKLSTCWRNPSMLKPFLETEASLNNHIIPRAGKIC